MSQAPMPGESPLRPALLNGRPIDEWGIRMPAGSCNPQGASVSRGGETNGPASVYAIAKWDEWLRKYAPPGAAGYDFYQSLPALAQGNVAQQIFWYTAFTANMVAPKKDGNNTVADKGTPLWRMAPSPHGPYWIEGMKVGYQDAGSWTLFKSTPVNRRKAAWLYAQFTVSKTTSLKKSNVGLTIIRDSAPTAESRLLPAVFAGRPIIGCDGAAARLHVCSIVGPASDERHRAAPRGGERLEMHRSCPTSSSSSSRSCSASSTRWCGHSSRKCRSWAWPGCSPTASLGALMA